MSRNRFQLGLFGRVKRLAMVPRVVNGRQEPEIAIGVSHHPLLRRFIHKNRHRVLHSSHILLLTEHARLGDMPRRLLGYKKSVLPSLTMLMDAILMLLSPSPEVVEIDDDSFYGQQ